MAVICRRNAYWCHAELCEALGRCAVLYWTLARWVQVFKSWKVSTANMPCSGYSAPVHTDMSVVINGQCTVEDRHWTMKELAKHTRISKSAVIHFWMVKLSQLIIDCRPIYHLHVTNQLSVSCSIVCVIHFRHFLQSREQKAYMETMPARTSVCPSVT